MAGPADGSMYIVDFGTSDDKHNDIEGTESFMIRLYKNRRYEGHKDVDSGSFARCLNLLRRRG